MTMPGVTQPPAQAARPTPPMNLGLATLLTYTIAIPCPECRSVLQVEVAVEPEGHPCVCPTPCPPERLVWRTVEGAQCERCHTAFDPESLDRERELDIAVQTGREVRA